MATKTNVVKVHITEIELINARHIGLHILHQLQDAGVPVKLKSKFVVNIADDDIIVERGILTRTDSHETGGILFVWKGPKKPT